MASFEKILLNEFDNVFGPYQYKSSSLFAHHSTKIPRTHRLLSQSDAIHITSGNFLPQALKPQEESSSHVLESRLAYERPFANSSLLLEGQSISTSLNFKPVTCRNNLELGTISPHFDENSRVSHNSLLDLRLQPYKSNETQNYRRSSIESLLEEREPSPFKQQLAQSNRGPPPGLGPDPVIQKEKLPAQKQALATKKTEYKQQPQGNLPEKQTINQQQQQQYYQQPQSQTKPRTPAQKTETANSKLPQAQPANLKSAENFVVVSEPKKNEKANLKTPSSLVEEEKVESFVKPKEQFQGRKSVGEAVNEDADSKNELKGQAKSTDEPTADRQQTTSQQRQEATSTAAGGTQIQSNQTPLVQGQEEPTKSPKKKKKPKKKKNQTEAAKEDVNDQETNKSLIKPESVVSTEEDIKELSFSDLEKIANVRQTVVDEEEIELTQSVKCRYTDMTYGFEELGNRYNVLKDNLIICDNFFAQNYLPQGSENTILSLNSVNEEPVEGGTKKKNKKRKRNKKKKSKKIEEDQGFTVEDLQAAAYTGQNPNIYAENYNFYFRPPDGSLKNGLIMTSPMGRMAYPQNFPATQ